MPRKRSTQDGRQAAAAQRQSDLSALEQLIADACLVRAGLTGRAPDYRATAGELVKVLDLCISFWEMALERTAERPPAVAKPKGPRVRRTPRREKADAPAQG